MLVNYNVLARQAREALNFAAAAAAPQTYGMCGCVCLCVSLCTSSARVAALTFLRAICASSLFTSPFVFDMVVKKKKVQK